MTFLRIIYVWSCFCGQFGKSDVEPCTVLLIYLSGYSLITFICASCASLIIKGTCCSLNRSLVPIEVAVATLALDIAFHDTEMVSQIAPAMLKIAPRNQ